MNLNEYHEFTQLLLNKVQGDERVVGLVALGSMAEQGRTPDAWSDHDFFLIVRSGTQESFRQDLSWLPDIENIILTIRETEHGLKVLYDTPHLIEFAVFDANELHGAKANDYAILLNRADIEQIMVQISARPPKPAYNAVRDMNMVLSLLYVGAGRYARGEKLSAHAFIKHHLLHHFLPLLINLNDANREKLDNLDPFRRFEAVYPALAEKINTALCLSPVACAKALLDVLVEETEARISPYPAKVVAVVRAYLDSCDV
ncbi:MAG TPA: aminoglycoside 6-adenylyltransferase [Aggregatilineales bacterium]|nr:aminoglycoside 6-adenylyltransferase [Aggregatilineales bacterium]